MADSKRLFSGFEILWQGNGVYTLTKKRDWVWVQLTDIDHVESALRAGQRIELVEEADATEDL